MNATDPLPLAAETARALESVTTATWTVGGARRHIVFGLRPGDSYDYFLDGSKKATLSVTREGSVDFDTSTSGKVELIRR